MADTDDAGPETRVATIERIFRTDYDNGPEKAVAEILADLRHYCDAHGLDYAERDRAAYGFYLAEGARAPDEDERVGFSVRLRDWGACA